MADNLETSQIVVQDEQGNNQLVQAVSNLSGTRIWDKGIQDAWCIVEDEQGNKQLALKVFNLGGGSGSTSAADVSFDNTDTTHITADNVQDALEQVDALIAPAEVTDLTSTSITLANAAANTVYKYGTLTSLTVTANDTSNLETLIYFTAGNSITVSLPQTLKTIGDITFDANTAYVLSIQNNIAVLGTIN